MMTVIVFGLIVGSFLNVAGLRWRSGRGLSGRSACAHCGETLRSWELIPVLSFLFLGRRCRHCRSKISWQYPLVELFTGIVFVTVPLVFVPVFCLYIVILIYDLKHKIIPDSLAYTALFLALLARLFFLHYFFLALMAALILFLFFSALWFFSRGRAMGFGDAKLALSVGLLLGPSAAFSAVVFAFWIGAAAGIFLLLRRRRTITMKTELAFAPFLILGAWLAAHFHPDLLHVATLF